MSREGLEELGKLTTAIGRFVATANKSLLYQKRSGLRAELKDLKDKILQTEEKELENQDDERLKVFYSQRLQRFQHEKLELEQQITSVENELEKTP